MKHVNRPLVALTLPLLLTLALGVLAACGSTSTAGETPTATTASGEATATPTTGSASSESQVNVSNFQFSPSTLTVKAGTTVTWKGVSGSHTVTSDSGAPMAFDQSISEGGTVTVTFTQAGTYKYHCSIHASMHGTIVVTA